LAIPSINKLVKYINSKITGANWNANFQQIINWLTDKTADVSFNSVEAKNITGDVTGTLTGDVTGTLTGDVTGTLTGNVTGTAYGTFKRIYSNTLAAATTSITISGLDGNTDLEYVVVCYFINNYAGQLNYNLIYNGDTSANYSYRGGIDQGTVSWQRILGTGQNNLSFSSLYQNKKNISIHRIFAKSGFEREGFYKEANYVTWLQVNTIWNNTTDNLISLTWTATQTNGFGIGTRIEIYARR
jgi:hypothetical protein